MFLLNRSPRLLGGGLLLAGGLYLWEPWAGRTPTNAPAVPIAADEQVLDLTSRPLAKISVGTVIGTEPPPGWSHLVLFATPMFKEDDLRDAPAIAADYARMFKFTVLAHVASERVGTHTRYWLERLARGFATDIQGQQVIINSQQTLGANMGLYGARILDENERILDRDFLQVARTNTMLIFDVQAVMRQHDDHVKMVVRHVVLVDSQTGRLHSLVWLLTRDFQAAEDAIQYLPNGMREPRYLSVKRDRFVLGIPTVDAFALWSIPQGTPIRYDERLKWAATINTFTHANVPTFEQILREAVDQATR